MQTALMTYGITDLLVHHPFYVVAVIVIVIGVWVIQLSRDKF
jgi:hypothetical protein